MLKVVTAIVILKKENKTQLVTSLFLFCKERDGSSFYSK